ncbi:hypothetical protein O7N88_001275 [Salmonella enterica]|jgi:hypothetical protein|uniref:hypothetical protein n=1 Tax=Citrobacter braakii TaxID=57706 RepID=UPI002A2C52CF|nr:hypothetical protein [Salmonella enterica]EKQ3591766.1 hypothetical protein [Salmonella enterica subsp. enterica serovar Cerro]
MTEDTKRGTALVRALNTNQLVDLGKDYGEITVDSLMESGLLKDIPVIKTVLGISDAIGGIRDYLFTGKLVRFLTHFSDLSDAQRINMTERLNSDENFAGKAGERLIEIIDRLESENKPEIAAAFLKAFSCKRIDFITLRRLMAALERIPAFDIEELDTFSQYNGNNHPGTALDQALMLSFVNAGLAENNGGFGGGIILPTKLCAIFVKMKEFKPE